LLFELLAELELFVDSLDELELLLALSVVFEVLVTFELSLSLVSFELLFELSLSFESSSTACSVVVSSSELSDEIVSVDSLIHNCDSLISFSILFSYFSCYFLFVLFFIILFFFFNFFFIKDDFLQSCILPYVLLDLNVYYLFSSYFLSFLSFESFVPY